MRYISMGGQRVSVVGLGAWQFGAAGWGWGTQFGPEEARQIVHRALELGVNFIDTAELYGGGLSERVVGDAVRGRRDDLLLATKVTPHHLLRGAVRRAAARSLDRLGVESLDLYQVHWPNPLVPTAWTMAGMRDLQQAGRVRQVGVSNYSLARWRRAEAALGGPVISNQLSYHLLNRAPERELLPYAQAQGRVLIAYSPLAQGMLSGRYAPDDLPRGARAPNPLFTPENARRAQPVVDVLRRVAGTHGATPAQIALAWLLRHPNVIVIPGAKSVAQVEANAAAADITLSDDEAAALTAASDGFRMASLWRSVPQVLRRLAPTRSGHPYPTDAEGGDPSTGSG